MDRLIGSESAIKIAVIAEPTGPLSFMGNADANVAKMVVDAINASEGVLSRQLALCLNDAMEDGALARFSKQGRGYLKLSAPRRRPLRRGVEKISNVTPDRPHVYSIDVVAASSARR
jgi:hypothetical protein